MQYSDTFNEVQEDLESLHLHYAAAEAHGLLCGLLTAHGDHSEHAWFSELAERSARPREALFEVDSLERLARETRGLLLDKGDLFMPLLPDEEAPLEERARAVRDWCIGFLFGLGLNQEAQDATLSSEAQEALRDFSEIARMDVDALEEEFGEGQDADESDQQLSDIVEYVRVAAAMIVDELMMGQTPGEDEIE
jgi:uncharacterized protein YgfB (UPF0149 family)